MIVAEGARHLDPPRDAQYERLHQPPPERSRRDRTPGPGGGEHPGDAPAGQMRIPAAAQLCGQSLMPPGAPLVVGDRNITMLQVRIPGVLAVAGFEEPGQLPGGVEEKYRTGGR